MHIIGIIPARLGSSRYPNKPLAEIHGVPMVGHVYFRSAMNTRLDAVYVATPDVAIREYVASIGGQAIMTSSAHQRASDRTAEALEKIEVMTGKRVDIVVMIQGDEPMLYPEMIDEALYPFLHETDVQVSNLSAPLQSQSEIDDPNEIKVVTDLQGFALYFSRLPIPTRWGGGDANAQKQVCIIPFKREFLRTFNALQPTPLEIAESIDMLRVLEHGYRVKVVPTKHLTYSVDTPADHKRVEKLMRDDPLMVQYRDKKS